MSIPGRDFAMHLFWKTVFRFPWVRLWLSRLFVPARDMDIQLFGAALRINSREEIGLARAARQSIHNVIFRDEVASIINLALLLQPGDVFVDIGANVGLYSAMLGRFSQVFPSTTFIAIEANPRTSDRLRQTVKDMHIEVLNVGVSDREDELAFEPGVTSGVFKVVESEKPGSTTRVGCQKLDSLPIPEGDLIVKIDVEGHELQVLNGAEELLTSERLKVIYLDGYSSQLIPPLLRRHGFEFFDGRTLARSGAVAPPYSLLAIHRTRLAAK